MDVPTLVLVPGMTGKTQQTKTNKIRPSMMGQKEDERQREEREERKEERGKRKEER